MLDGLQDLARPVALGAQHASLRAGLHDDHRHVVGDHVVQLACDAGALLDDGLPRGQIAFALGDLRALLAIADDAVDEQQDDEVTTSNGRVCWSVTTPSAASGFAIAIRTTPTANNLGCAQTASAYRQHIQAMP